MHLHTFNFNYNLNGCFTVDKGLVIYRYKKKQPNNVMVLISLRSKCLEDERKNKKIYEEIKSEQFCNCFCYFLKMIVKDKNEVNMV